MYTVVFSSLLPSFLFYNSFLAIPRRSFLLLIISSVLGKQRHGAEENEYHSEHDFSLWEKTIQFVIWSLLHTLFSTEKPRRTVWTRRCPTDSFLLDNKKYNPTVFEPLYIVRQHEQLVQQVTGAQCSSTVPTAGSWLTVTSQASCDDMPRLEQTLARLVGSDSSSALTKCEPGQITLYVSLSWQVK